MDQQQDSIKGEPENANSQVHEVVIQKMEFGEKASGKFAKIAGTIAESPVLIIARGDKAVQKAGDFQKGSTVSLVLNKENGFLFLVDVVESSQKVG